MDHNLQEVLMPIAIMGSMAFGVTIISKTFTNYFLKKRIVEKGLEKDQMNELLKNHEAGDGNLASLKWGLIILFAGIGLMIIDTIPFDQTSTLPYGIFATSVSLGFLIYYFIVNKQMKS